LRQHSLNVVAKYN